MNPWPTFGAIPIRSFLSGYGGCIKCNSISSLSLSRPSVQLERQFIGNLNSRWWLNTSLFTLGKLLQFPEDRKCNEAGDWRRGTGCGAVVKINPMLIQFGPIKFPFGYSWQAGTKWSTPRERSNHYSEGGRQGMRKGWGKIRAAAIRRRRWFEWMNMLFIFHIICQAH